MERVGRRAALRFAAASAAGLLAGCSGGNDPGTPAADGSIPDGPGWLTFAHDAGNTGRATAAAPTSHATATWHESTPREPTGTTHRFASPLVGETTGYALTPDGTLRALALSDGSVRWALSDAAPATPAVAGGTLYYRALRGEQSPVQAVDVVTGEPAWERTFDRLVERGGLTVAYDTVYASGGPEPVYALATDGDLRWTAEGPASVGAPAVADDGLFVTTREGLQAYDAATGKSRWSRAVESRDAPSVAADRLFVGTEAGVRAFGTDGEPRWTVPFDAPVRGTPAVAGDTVVAATTEGTVAALAASDGSRRWHVDLENAVNAPVAVAADRVLVPTHREDVVALSLSDGSEVWRAWIRDPVQAMPAVAGGRVLVQDAADRATLLANDGGGPSFPDVGEWTAAYGDPGNTNRAPGATLPSDPAVEWRTPLAAQRARALVAGGRVLAADDDGVYAFSAASGRLDWRHAALDADVGTSVCAVAGDRLLAGVGEAFHAFELAPETGAGQSDWRVTLPNGRIITAATVAAGTAYVVAYDAGELAAVDAATGEVAWTLHRTTGFSHSPAVAGDHVYVGPTQGDLYAVDRATGEVTGEATLSDTWSLTPLAVRDGRAFTATKKGIVFGYDVPACERAWRTGVGDGSRNVFLAPPAVANGRVYVPSLRGAVHAFEAETGEPVATTDLPAGVQAAPRVVDGYLLVGTWKDREGARLYALSLDDLSKQWSATVFESDGADSIGCIAPVGDRLYVSGSGVALVR